MRLRLDGTGNLAAGGRVFALRCADSELRGTDRRRLEARALASWLDRHRDRLHLPDGEDFCPGKEDHTALPALAWRRVRVAVTRLLRPGLAAAEPPIESLAGILGKRLHLDEVECDLLRLAMQAGLPMVPGGGPVEQECPDAPPDGAHGPDGAVEAWEDGAFVVFDEADMSVSDAVILLALREHRLRTQRSHRARELLCSPIRAT